MALVVAATAGLLAGCSGEAEPTTGRTIGQWLRDAGSDCNSQEVSSPLEVAEAGPLGLEETGLVYATAGVAVVAARQRPARRAEGQSAGPSGRDGGRARLTSHRSESLTTA